MPTCAICKKTFECSNKCNKDRSICVCGFCSIMTFIKYAEIDLTELNDLIKEFNSYCNDISEKERRRLVRFFIAQEM